MKNNREMFMKWLNGRETPDHLRDYNTVFPAIEAYAKSKKIIYGPIFDIDDPAIIETISQRLSNDKFFRLWHKKRIKTMTDAMELFGKYTRESAMEAGVPAEPSSEEDTSEPIQAEPNQTEPVQAEPVISVPENPVSSADNAEITAKRESFANWLKLQPGYTEATADEYAKAISDIDGFAKEYGLAKKSFYLAADNAEISAMFRAILQSDEYFKVIDNTHRLLFMGAISRYNSFLTAAKENLAETPAQADALEPKKPAEPVYPETIASKPEKPAEPVCPEVAASKPEKPAEPACSEVSASVPENTIQSADADKIKAAQRSFIAWMKQNSYVDLVIEKTVKSISAVDDFAKKNALLDKSIFLAKDEDELHQAVSKITLSGKFNTAFDGRQGKAFFDSLERYNSFLKSASEDVAGLVPTGVPRELTQDEIDKADEMRQEFCRWMKRLKYSDAAAEKTAELISTVDDFCEKYRLLEKSIFLIKSNEELQQALGELRKSSKYEYAYNDSQHRAFSAALEKYGKFLLSDHIKQAEQRKQAIAEKKRIEAERLANAARIEAEQNMPVEVAAVSAAETAHEKPAEPARRQAPAQSEYQAAERSYTARTNGGRDEFMQWLINGGTPSGTANSYTNSVESLGEAMRQRGIEPRSIFSIGDEQRLKQLMEEMLRCRILTPVAPETRAFKKYIVFRMNGTANVSDEYNEKPAEVKTETVVQRAVPAARKLNAAEERLAAVLETRFENGLRINSIIDRSRFKQYYFDMHNAELTLGDDELIAALKRIGTVRDDRIFAKDEAAQGRLTGEMLADIKGLFDGGATCVYFSELFKKYSDGLAQLQIYTIDGMKDLLISEAKGKLYPTKNCFRRLGGYPNESGEVERVIKQSAMPMNADDVCRELWYISEDVVKRELKANSNVANVGVNTYFYARNLPVSEEELDEVADFIGEALAQKSSITDNELQEIIERDCPSVAINTEGLGKIALRKCLAVLLGDRFSFKGAIISEKGAEMSTTQAFRDFCRSHDTLTLDELNEFAKRVTPRGDIYWNPVMSVMARISYDEFVPKKQLKFDVQATDAVLDRMIDGDYVPLQDFKLFLQYPAANVKWNTFVLESYVANYSRDFTLMHACFTKNGGNGAIVRRSSPIRDFSALLRDVLIHDDSWNTKDEALTILVDRGYMLVKRVTGIDEIIATAKIQREQLHKTNKR